MLNIVIPMAGAGIRFHDTDHEKPKPLIDVANGIPMIQLATKCLTPTIEHRFIFICQKAHDEHYSLDELFQRITIHYEKVIVDEVTEGPACSVLLANAYIDNDEPMMTGCSDDFLDTDINRFIEYASQNEAEGTIMTYLGFAPAGSYAKVNEEGLVTEVAEKKVISPYTTAGVYYFSKGRYFVEAAEQMIAADKRTQGEFYVCPVYNEMIARQKTIKAYQMDSKNMHTMGTPEALTRFQKLIEDDPQIIA